MGSEDISGLMEAYAEVYANEEDLEEGLRRRIGAAALGAGLAAGSLGAGGAARAGQWSGQVQARYGSTPAVATQSSVSGAVDRALAKPGSSQSASEIKGKTGVTGSANVSYSGIAGPTRRQQPASTTTAKPNVKPVAGKPVAGKPIPGKPVPGKPDIKKVDDKKDIKYDGKPIPGKDVKKPVGSSPLVVPGRGPAGQQLTPLINAIRNATGEADRDAGNEKSLGPRTVNGRTQTGAERLRGVIDAIRNAQNINRNKQK